jgi:hypothetical protein
MKFSLFRCVAFAASIFFSLAPSNHAESIGIKFIDSEDVAFGTASAGAPGFAQENWNFFLTDWSGNVENDPVFIAGLVDSAGNLVGGALQEITYGANSDPVHYDAANTWRSGAGNVTPDDTLMNGYLDDGGNNQPYLNLSLAPETYSVYSVVVYVHGDVDAGAIGRYWLEEWTDPLAEGTVITDQVGIQANDYFGAFTKAGGANFSQTATPMTVDVADGNFIVFDNITARNVRIRSAGNGDPNEDFGRGPLNAVQIIDATEDRDGDGLPDAWETANMLDPDDNGLNPNNNGEVGNPENGADGNPDGDGLTNLEEFQRGTNPRNGDTDGDTLADEVENETGEWVDASNTGTNPRLADTDGDGFNDNIENCSGIFNSPEDPGTDPNLADSDMDMLPDGWEVANMFDPNSDVGDDGEQGDIDNDLSPNVDEFTRGTDPNDPDSDDDNLLDGAEDGGGTYVDASQTGTDPLDEDSDGDTLTDDVESNSGVLVDEDDTGTNPNLADTDGDFFRDDWEIANGKDPFDGVGLDTDKGGIGLNFGSAGANGTDAGAALLPTDITGIARQANWNNLPGAAGGPVALLNNQGADSGATVTWTTDEEWSNGAGGSADGTLLVGWVSANTGVENPITIADIPFAAYDLVVYYNHDRGTEDVDFGERNGAFPTVRLHETDDPTVADLNPFVQQVATADGDASQVGSFYYIPELTASTLNLFINSAGAEGSADRGAISGIQLIATADDQPFAITSIELLDGGPGLVDVELTWNSEPDQNYAIFVSSDLKSWLEIDDTPSSGNTTTYTEIGVPESTPRRYYRVGLQ